MQHTSTPGNISRSLRPILTARIPGKFLTDTALLGRMVTDRSEQVFDVYLFLLWQSYLPPPDSAES